MMRVLLFVVINIAVLVLLNIVLFIVQGVFHVRLGNYSGLLLMAAVLGMGGSFISLAMSKWIAKRTTGAQVGRAGRLVARPDAHAQAAHAGRRGPGQQDRPDRLGGAGQRRDLPSSGAGGLTASSRGVEA